MITSNRNTSTNQHDPALHYIYQEVALNPMLCRSHSTTSLHLNFGPWNGLADNNSPNNIRLGKQSASSFPSALATSPVLTVHYSLSHAKLQSQLFSSDTIPPPKVTRHPKNTSDASVMEGQYSSHLGSLDSPSFCPI